MNRCEGRDMKHKLTAVWKIKEFFLLTDRSVTSSVRVTDTHRHIEALAGHYSNYVDDIIDDINSGRI